MIDGVTMVNETPNDNGIGKGMTAFKTLGALPVAGNIEYVSRKLSSFGRTPLTSETKSPPGECESCDNADRC
jgi:hypothetical protein